MTLTSARTTCVGLALCALWTALGHVGAEAPSGDPQAVLLSEMAEIGGFQWAPDGRVSLPLLLTIMAGEAPAGKRGVALGRRGAANQAAAATGPALVGTLISAAAPITVEEIDPLVKYLSSVFGPNAPSFTDVNAASRDELAKLPGVTPAAAERLIAARGHAPLTAREEVRTARPRYTGLRKTEVLPVREAVGCLEAPVTATVDTTAAPRSCGRNLAEDVLCPVLTMAQKKERVSRS